MQRAMASSGSPRRRLSPKARRFGLLPARQMRVPRLAPLHRAWGEAGHPTVVGGSSNKLGNKLTRIFFFLFGVCKMNRFAHLPAGHSQLIQRRRRGPLLANDSIWLGSTPLLSQGPHRGSGGQSTLSGDRRGAEEPLIARGQGTGHPEAASSPSSPWTTGSEVVFGLIY